MESDYKCQFDDANSSNTDVESCLLETIQYTYVSDIR